MDNESIVMKKMEDIVAITNPFYKVYLYFEYEFCSFGKYSVNIMHDVRNIVISIGTPN